MAKLKAADFYYGAVLSILFNNRINPAIVQGGEDRQVYDFATNNGEFRLFIKYRTNKKAVKKEDYYSWNFVFSDSDKEEIKDYIKQGCNLFVALLCGVDELSNSEIMILNKDEIIELIETKSKSSLSVSRQKGERAFRISVGGGRSKAMQIKTNRFEELFLSAKIAS